MKKGRWYIRGGGGRKESNGIKRNRFRRCFFWESVFFFLVIRPTVPTVSRHMIYVCLRFVGRRIKRDHELLSHVRRSPRAARERKIASRNGSGLFDDYFFFSSGERYTIITRLCADTHTWPGLLARNKNGGGRGNSAAIITQFSSYHERRVQGGFLCTCTYLRIPETCLFAGILYPKVRVIF